MSEYTSLDMSKRLQAAGFKAEPDTRYEKVDGLGDSIGYDSVSAYRADTLLEWLLSHGDSIEVTPDLDGFNCTFWKGHHDYNGISIFLPDALGELILQVMEDEHGTR